MKLIWLAADYHFPSSYSIRIPNLSTASAKTMPAPGPATVRLALISASIEFGGLDFAKSDVFPLVRYPEIYVRPPERVSITSQIIWNHKWSTSKGKVLINKAPVCREFALAHGLMTVYICVPKSKKKVFCSLLRMIGYWGQSSSLAYCMGVEEREPISGQYGLPLAKVSPDKLIQEYFSCYATEFKSPEITWEDIVPPKPERRPISPLSMELYIWPMKICEKQGANMHLARCPL